MLPFLLLKLIYSRLAFFFFFFFNKCFLKFFSTYPLSFLLFNAIGVTEILNTPSFIVYSKLWSELQAACGRSSRRQRLIASVTSVGTWKAMVTCTVIFKIRVTSSALRAGQKRRRWDECTRRPQTSRAHDQHGAAGWVDCLYHKKNNKQQKKRKALWFLMQQITLAVERRCQLTLSKM